MTAVEVKDSMSYGDALSAAQWEGKKIARRGWRLAGMYLTVEPVSTHSSGKLLMPHILIHLPEVDDRGAYCYPIQPNVHDQLSVDWYIVKE